MRVAGIMNSRQHFFPHFGKKRNEKKKNVYENCFFFFCEFKNLLDFLIATIHIAIQIFNIFFPFEHIWTNYYLTFWRSFVSKVEFFFLKWWIRIIIVLQIVFTFAQTTRQRFQWKLKNFKFHLFYSNFKWFSVFCETLNTNMVKTTTAVCTRDFIPLRNICFRY